MILESDITIYLEIYTFSIFRPVAIFCPPDYRHSLIPDYTRKFDIRQ